MFLKGFHDRRLDLRVGDRAGNEGSA